MYKPKRKLLEQGLITPRSDYFYLMGREYTFRGQDFDRLGKVIGDRINAMGVRGIGCKVYEDKPIIVVNCYGSWKYEFYRNGRMENDNTYTGFFSGWQMYGLNTQYDQEMNRLMTCLETLFVELDPLAWVRDVPMKRHVTNGIGASPEIWEADPPDRTLTREAAAEKKYVECYLADELRAGGIDLPGGKAFEKEPPEIVHPTIARRLERNLKKEKEEKEAAEKKALEPVPEPPKKFCDQCGREIKAGSKFCPGCGAPVRKTIEEKKAEEVTLKKYPFFFVCEPENGTNPYLYVNFDAEGNVIPQPDDGDIRYLKIRKLKLSAKQKESTGFSPVYESAENEDTDFLVTDSRIAVINREYNKNDAGEWLGIGGLTAMAVGAAITAGGRAVMKKKRGESVLAGHLRYEWVECLYFNRKQKFLESETLRFLFRDQEKTRWMLTIIFDKGTDTELIANDILRRLAVLRGTMLDDRGEKMNAFIEKYKTGQNRIPINPDPKQMSGVTVPDFYYASRGLPFRR